MYKRILFFVAILVHLAGTHYPVNESRLSLPHLDKVLHFSIFFTLMWLGRVNWPCMPLFRAMLFAGVYAAFDELTQLWVVGRSAEIADWTADVLGAVAAYYVYQLLRPKKFRISLTNE